MTIRTNDVVLLAARLAVAALFLPSGIGKLFNLSGFAAGLAGKGLPFPDLLAVLGVAAEILGPIALILGVAPRLTALLLIAFTLVASLVSHNFWDFADAAARRTQETQFFKNLAIIGGLLFYFASGAGALSLPRLVGVPRAAGEAQAGNPADARGSPWEASRRGG